MTIIERGNPYRLVGQVADGDRFVGRTTLLAQIRSAWRQPGRPSNLRVVGHYRTGKTSLVRRAVSTSGSDRPDLVCAWLNVGSLESGMDMFRTLTRRIREAFGDSAGELNAIDSAVQSSASWYDLTEPVRDFFHAVLQAGRYVLLVLDEFDRAATVLGKLAEFQLLRDLASEADYPLGLITISRRPIESIEIDTAGGSILGGVVTTHRYVGMFTDAEADLMLARAAQTGVGLAAVRGDIVERSGRHPFLLEVLCNRIVEDFVNVGAVDVAAAYIQVRPTFEAQFAQLQEGVDSDSEGRGADLLRSIAAGAEAPASSADLNRLELMGIVDSGRLFSRYFARYLLATGVTRRTI